MKCLGGGDADVCCQGLCWSRNSHKHHLLPERVKLSGRADITPCSGPATGRPSRPDHHPPQKMHQNYHSGSEQLKSQCALKEGSLQNQNEISLLLSGVSLFNRLWAPHAKRRSARSHDMADWWQQVRHLTALHQEKHPTRLLRKLQFGKWRVKYKWLHKWI